MLRPTKLKRPSLEGSRWTLGDGSDAKDCSLFGGVEILMSGSSMSPSSFLIPLK